MKKLLFIAIAFLFSLSQGVAVLAQTELEEFPTGIEAMVIDKTSTEITALLGGLDSLSGETTAGFYDLNLEGCSVADFSEGDLIFIESVSTTIPQAGDFITDRMSLFNPTEGFIILDNCRISKVTQKYSGYINMLMTAQLGNLEYAVESADGQEYLLQNQGSCLVEQAGELSLIFIKQQSAAEPQTSDQIIYAMRIDFDNLEFDFVPVSGCYLGVITKVHSDDAEYMGKGTGNYQILIKDVDLNKTYNLTVAANCALLTGEGYEYGEITYFNNTSVYDEPIYVSFIDEAMNTTEPSAAALSEILNNNICEVLDYSLVSIGTPEGLYQRPVPNINLNLVNYYIGKWGKKVYTDRPNPQDMIGAMVKGETDPATYIVDIDGKLRWLKDEDVAKRLFGDDWDSQITWFSDSIIYTYQFGETIEF